MKTPIASFLICIVTTFPLQADKAEDCDCPPPSKDDIIGFCLNVKQGLVEPDDSPFIYAFERSLWEMSCAKAGSDSEEKAKEKIRKMWNKYKLCFACDMLGFSVPNGNILKLSMDSAFPDFVDMMVRDYKVVYDFKDPADGKTLLEFVESEIEKFKSYSNDNSLKIRELEKIKKLLIENKS